MKPGLPQGGYIHSRVQIIPGGVWLVTCAVSTAARLDGTNEPARPFANGRRLDTSAAEEISPSDMNPPSCSLISDWHIRG